MGVIPFFFFSSSKNFDFSKLKKDQRLRFKVYVLSNGEVVSHPVWGFPISIFVICETAPVKILTTESGNTSDFFFWTPHQHICDIALAAQRVSTIGAFSLFDHFGWVIPAATREDDLYTLSTILISLLLNTRLISFSNFYGDSSAPSLSAFCNNAVWVERESSEMLDLVYFGLKDTRKLLLDYTTPRGVLHRLNHSDFFSNFFKNYSQVNYEIF